MNLVRGFELDQNKTKQKTKQNKTTTTKLDPGNLGGSETFC